MKGGPDSVLVHDVELEKLIQKWLNPKEPFTFPLSLFEKKTKKERIAMYQNYLPHKVIFYDYGRKNVVCWKLNEKGELELL